MQTNRYLECLATDYRRLVEVAGGRLDAPVPSCPEWSMKDLVEHVAMVYLHKSQTMRTGKQPEQWPPDASGEAPIALLHRAYGELTDDFASREPELPAHTWYGPDQTVGFWIRRMAQETVVHRIDAELAAGVGLAEVPDDLAIDGIDEVLERFLAYATRTWAEDFTEMIGANDGRAVRVTAGDRSWLVRLDQPEVTVHPDSDDQAAAQVSGDPSAVLRWLWRRADDEVVRIEGEQEPIVQLRRLLGVATL